MFWRRASRSVIMPLDVGNDRNPEALHDLRQLLRAGIDPQARFGNAAQPVMTGVLPSPYFSTILIFPLAVLLHGEALHIAFVHQDLADGLFSCWKRALQRNHASQKFALRIRVSKSSDGICDLHAVYLLSAFNYQLAFFTPGISPLVRRVLTEADAANAELAEISVRPSADLATVVPAGRVFRLLCCFTFIDVLATCLSLPSRTGRP